MARTAKDIAPAPLITQRLGPADRLNAGETLNPGDGLISLNGLYRAEMQSDGNFVVYIGTGVNPIPGWNAGMEPHVITEPNSHLSMQNDGNLVLYAPSGQARWQSATSGAGSGCFLKMQDDGNLCIWGPGNRIWWRSGILITYEVVSVDNVHYGPPTNISDEQVVTVIDQSVENGSSIQQETQLDYQFSVTDTATFSESNAVTVGAKLSITAGDPKYVQGKMEVSVAHTRTITWGKEHSNTVHYTQKVPVDIPPKSKILAELTVRQVTMTVPWKGDALFKVVAAPNPSDNKRTFSGPLQAVFTGRTGYSFEVKFTETALPSESEEGSAEPAS